MPLDQPAMLLGQIVGAIARNVIQLVEQASHMQTPLMTIKPFLIKMVR